MAINLDLMILKLLSDKDMYGYQLVTELKNVSDEFFSLKTGTVYPLLRTMVTDNLLESYEKEYSGKVRTHYRITLKGKQKLNSGIEYWIEYCNVVNRILEVKQNGGEII